MKKNSILIYQIACILLLIILAVFAFQIHSSGNDAESTENGKDALSVIHSRKSVRTFIPNKQVSKDDVQTLLKAGMAAPSGRDNRPWEFVVVNDREKLNAMAAELPFAKMLTDAPMAIVVCGDTTKSFYWYLDCSAAAQNILLAAEALNLGAVWTAAYPYDDRMDAVSRNINLPAHIRPLAVIPVGHPKGETSPKNKFNADRIHFNTY